MLPIVDIVVAALEEEEEDEDDATGDSDTLALFSAALTGGAAIGCTSRDREEKPPRLPPRRCALAARS